MPPQPPPGPPPKQSGGCLAAIGISAVGGAIFLAVMNTTQQRPQAPLVVNAPPPARSTRRLTGVALYKGRMGFSFCTRAPLHRCTFWFGSAASGETATIRSSHVFDVDPVVSCEGIGSNAIGACADAGSLPTLGRPLNPAWVQCTARNGWYYRGDGTVTILDPRDEGQQSAGGFRLECNEGYSTGSFDDAL